MKRDNLVALFYVCSAVVVMVVSLLARTEILASFPLKPLGFVVFVSGMFLFSWAGISLKRAFLATVEPIGNRLETSGPYRFVRHPSYLGTAIALIGLALGLRSIWGLVGTLVFFTPIAIWRAKLEEQALARRFGKEWADYVSRTWFMFPPLH